MELELHEELVKQCVEGDSKAQAILYTMYSKTMYNVCLRIMNDVHEAEDALQLAFVDIFRNLKQFKFDSTPGAWIKRVVTNRCLSELRKRKMKLIGLDDQHEPIDESYVHNEPSPHYSVESIKKAMSALPDGYRIVFSLYAFEGYDHSEISEILGVSISTSKSQYHRAKQRIKDYLINKNDVV